MLQYIQLYYIKIAVNGIPPAPLILLIWHGSNQRSWHGSNQRSSQTLVGHHWFKELVHDFHSSGEQQFEEYPGDFFQFKGSE